MASRELEKYAELDSGRGTLAASLPTPDRCLPYLLKLADQKETYSYHQPFNSVIMHDLLLALLRGELTNPESVVKWLDINAAQ